MKGKLSIANGQLINFRLSRIDQVSQTKEKADFIEEILPPSEIKDWADDRFGVVNIYR